MLFIKKELSSPYDFGENNDISEELSDLACHIADQVAKIEELIYADGFVELATLDNLGNPVYIKSIKPDVFERDKSAIKQLLFRKTDKTTISAYLKDWGVKIPDSTNEQWKDYLKCLYFFYMCQYVLFSEENNLFRMLSADKMSTDFSAIPYASNGKYFSIMIDNMLLEKEVQDYWIDIDGKINILAEKIPSLIDELVEGVYINNTKIVNEIEQIIDDTHSDYRNEKLSVINQIFDYIYRYQYMAYASEMIKALNNDDRFQFKELEIEADLAWENENVNMSEIRGFIERSDVKRFYMQGYSHEPSQLDRIILNIISYDKNVYKEYGESLLFGKTHNDSYRINGLELAVLVRTILDLGTTYFEINIKRNERQWEKKKSYRVALSEEKNDIAYRLFIIAYESEMMNVERGYGYYPTFFRPIFIGKYKLMQRCMQRAFEIDSPEGRVNYLVEIYEKLQHLKS